MVSKKNPIAARLAGLLRWGSMLGVSVSCLGVIGMTLGGHPLVPSPLVWVDWCAGRAGLFEILAGAGLLLLATTPVLMLAALAAHAVRGRRWRTVAVAGGVGLVLTAGLVLALAGGP